MNQGTITGFRFNEKTGREEMWGNDGYRWVAAEPMENEFYLWGYQKDSSEVRFLGNSADESAILTLAMKFLDGGTESGGDFATEI